MTNVLGHGMQKGNPTFFRGAPMDTRLLPKVKIDVVVCKIPTEAIVETVQKVLYTGKIGDGKIFIYKVVTKTMVNKYYILCNKRLFNEKLGNKRERG